jgi:hypothetical protein
MEELRIVHLVVLILFAGTPLVLAYSLGKIVGHREGYREGQQSMKQDGRIGHSRSHSIELSRLRMGLSHAQPKQDKGEG